jgi:hypothetical protein
VFVTAALDELEADIRLLGSYDSVPKDSTS